MFRLRFYFYTWVIELLSCLYWVNWCCFDLTNEGDGYIFGDDEGLILLDNDWVIVVLWMDWLLLELVFVLLLSFWCEGRENIFFLLFNVEYLLYCYYLNYCYSASRLLTLLIV